MYGGSYWHKFLTPFEIFNESIYFVNFIKKKNRKFVA